MTLSPIFREKKTEESQTLRSRLGWKELGKQQGCSSSFQPSVCPAGVCSNTSVCQTLEEDRTEGLHSEGGRPRAGEGGRHVGTWDRNKPCALSEPWRLLPPPAQGLSWSRSFDPQKAGRMVRLHGAVRHGAQRGPALGLQESQGLNSILDGLTQHHVPPLNLPVHTTVFLRWIIPR